MAPIHNVFDIRPDRCVPDGSPEIQRPPAFF